MPFAPLSHPTPSRTKHTTGTGGLPLYSIDVQPGQLRVATGGQEGVRLWALSTITSGGTPPPADSRPLAVLSDHEGERVCVGMIFFLNAVVSEGRFFLLLSSLLNFWKKKKEANKNESDPG